MIEEILRKVPNAHLDILIRQEKRELKQLQEERKRRAELN